MKRIIPILLAVFMGFGMLVSLQPAFADSNTNISPLNGAPATTTVAPPTFYTGGLITRTTGYYSFDCIINVLLPGVAKYIAGFIGALAILFLIWAGIQFLTAEGEPDKIGQATKTAFYVIAGLLLVIFAYALVYLFLTIFAPPPPPAAEGSAPTTLPAACAPPAAPSTSTTPSPPGTGATNPSPFSNP